MWPSQAPILMGVLNVTPDSFSDGGRFIDLNRAVTHASQMVKEGAEIIDVGGESTRPGAAPVSLDEELRRVVPVVEAIVANGSGAKISVDTTKYRVVSEAIAAGASFINDVTAFRAEPAIAELVAEHGLQCCLMHMQGTPQTMQQQPQYSDVVDQVVSFLQERVEFALNAGVKEQQIVLDPGIGFGKTLQHNIELINGLERIVAIGMPVLIGLSRKSLIGELTGQAVAQRLSGTVAANLMAWTKGATILRVHDVAEHRDALLVAAGISQMRYR